jgi:hypothetical protein
MAGVAADQVIVELARRLDAYERAMAEKRAQDGRHR